MHKGEGRGEGSGKKGRGRTGRSEGGAVGHSCEVVARRKQVRKMR